MQTSALKQKLAAARLAWITVGDVKFQVRRPGELDFLRLASAGRRATTLEAAIDAVRGWQGVTQAHFGDLTASAGADPVDFDADLVEELLTDRQDLIVGLVNGVADLIAAARGADAEKKA